MPKRTKPTPPNNLPALRQRLGERTTTLPWRLRPEVPLGRAPATEVEVEEVIETILALIDVVADALTAEQGHQMLREDILKNLKTGAVSRMKVIAAAEAGNAEADIALRELGAEYISRWCQHGDEQEPPPPEIAAFLQRAWFRPPASNPKGWNCADRWLRDITIANLVKISMDLWHLPKSRGHTSKYPERSLSASYLVSLALERSGIMLSEGRVARIFDNRPELVTRMSAFVLISGV